MAYQEIVATDTLNEGRVKVNANLVELYTAIASASPVSITGAISLTGTALGKIHVCTGTTSNYTVDLPTAVGNTGASIIFKGANALTKDVTLAGVSGQTIDGESSRQFSTDGSFTIMSDGSNWIVINEVGSWVSYTTTPGGYSADPGFSRVDYFRVGKLCTVRLIQSTSGTSSATTTTITVPFNAADVITSSITTIVNSGAVQAAAGVARTRLNSSTVDLYRTCDLGTTAWTASGTKGVGHIVLTYRIA